MVSSMLDNMQPDLQQIWQEALDNVRKQQILYREKVEEVTMLRATVREVLVGAKQLASYAMCIENMSSVIDPKYAGLFLELFSLLDVHIPLIQLQWKVYANRYPQ